MNGELITDRRAAELLGVSRAWLYHQLRRDPSFPRKVCIPGSQSKAWRRSELVAWIETLGRDELTGVDAVTRRRALREAA